MAMFSKIAQSWYFDSGQNLVANQATGDFKFCLFGLTMTTDSPKLLVFSVTCGVVSISLLSSATRALLSGVFHKVLNILSDFISHPSAAAAPIQMGQVQPLHISTSVHLDNSRLSSADLIASYEIIDLPSPTPRQRNAQPAVRKIELRSVAVGTEGELKTTCDRACSPCFVNYLMESSCDDLMVFGDNAEMQDGSLISLEAGENVLSQESSELHEKFASIQQALDGFSEEMKEMNQTMSSLSALSRRYYTTIAVPSPPPNKSSSDSTANSSSLIWEDEFDGLLSTPRTQTPTLAPHSQTDVKLWEWNLDVFSTLTKPVEKREDNARDSGCGGDMIWDENTDCESTLCSHCYSSMTCHDDAGRRAFSAPSTSGKSSPTRSVTSNSESALVSSLNPSPDRVPKRRVRRT